MLRRLTGLLILTLLLTLAACGSDDAGSGGTEGGEDGDPPDLVTATVNGIAIALNPHGQTLDQPITIEAIDPPDGASDTFVAAFRMLPAGATFSTPVTLSIDLPGEPLVALTGIHDSDGDANTELISLLPVAYDPASDTTTYEAEVTHFSEIQVERWGDQVETRLLPPIPGDRYLVGDSFTMRVRAVPRSIASRDGAIYDGRQTRVVNVKPEVMTFTATWKSAGQPAGIDFADVVTFKFFSLLNEYADSPLTPTEIDADPHEQRVTDGQSLTFDQEFRCVSPGRFIVWFRGHLRQPGESTTFEGATVVDRSAVNRYAYAVSAITGECVLPAATTTPTPGTAFTSTPVAAATGNTAGAIPTIVVPRAPRIPTPVVPGSGDPAGFIKVYAYNGAWYYADTLKVTPAHPPHCSYEHLHGSPIPAVPIDGRTLPPLAEMYGECGFGPTHALYWILPPR